MFRVGDKAKVTGPLRLAGVSEPGGVSLLPGEEVRIVQVCAELDPAFPDDDVLALGSISGREQYIDGKSLTLVSNE